MWSELLKCLINVFVCVCVCAVCVCMHECMCVCVCVCVCVCEVFSSGEIAEMAVFKQGVRCFS